MGTHQVATSFVLAVLFALLLRHSVGQRWSQPVAIAFAKLPHTLCYVAGSAVKVAVAVAVAMWMEIALPQLRACKTIFEIIELAPWRFPVAVAGRPL